MHPTQPAKITQEIVSGTPPALRQAGVSPMPTRRQELSADPQQEYVAGGSYPWLASFLRSLPYYIDDVTADFGDDLYDRIMLDPQVSSCVNTLKMSALAQGLTLRPPVSDKDARLPEAERIKAFCQQCLDNLEEPLMTTLWDMSSAVEKGNRAAEITYEIPTSGPLLGKLVPKKIKVKPRHSVAYVVDAYMNVVGILGRLPDLSAPLLPITLIPDVTTPNLLPREKFAILSFRVRDNDPRGVSILRVVYNAWWLKTQVWPEYLKYIAQFASPSLVGYAPPESIATETYDEAGNVVRDNNGNVIYIKPEQALMQSLLAFRNGSVVGLPSGAKVEPIQVEGTGAPFIDGVEFFNREISTGILGQTLATGEGQHQARAASEVHQDILGLPVQHLKEHLQILVVWMMKQWVRYNFGPDAVPLTPLASLAETEQNDFGADATAVGELEKSGYLDPSQYAATDAKLGLPARTPEEVAARTERALAPPPDPNAAPNAPGNKTETDPKDGSK